MTSRATTGNRILIAGASLVFWYAAPAHAQHREVSPAVRAAVEARVRTMLADREGDQRRYSSENGAIDGGGSGEIDALSAGLASWRKADQFLGASCAECHAPDALDLAFFNFSDEQIARRAAFHVPDEDVLNILDLVHLIRDQYNITPLDPMQDRALQPAGFVLPGANQAARDGAFGKMLKGTLQLPDATHQAMIDRHQFPLTIAKRKINSLSLARQARDELMNLDVRALPIGIPLNRWSEDPFHGQAHAMFADWVPDLPAIPASGRRQQWIAAQDAYVQDPSDENFWTLYWFCDTYCPQFDDAYGSLLMKRKYQSMLLAQHLLRNQAMGIQLWDLDGPVAFLDQRGRLPNGRTPNPFWEVGDLAQMNPFVATHRTQGIAIIGLPNFVNQRLRNDWTAWQHGASVRAQWLWLGWMLDPGMKFGAATPNAVSYFSKHLWSDDRYPIHNAFMTSKMWVSRSCDSRMHNPQNSSNQLRLWPFLGKFTFEEYHKQFEPAAGANRNNYRRYVSNLFAMILYTMQEDMNTRNGVIDRSERKVLIDEADSYFRFIGESSTSSYRKLVRDVRQRMAQLPNL